MRIASYIIYNKCNIAIFNCTSQIFPNTQTLSSFWETVNFNMRASRLMMIFQVHNSWSNVGGVCFRKPHLITHKWLPFLYRISQWQKWYEVATIPSYLIRMPQKHQNASLIYCRAAFRLKSGRSEWTKTKQVKRCRGHHWRRGNNRQQTDVVE